MRNIEMNINIKKIESSNNNIWDVYVYAHPDATLYHLSGWKDVIEQTYGHKTYYLMAANSSSDSVAGIFPLVHLKHFLFGSSLISIPFFDIGGILAENEAVEKALLAEALKLGQKLKVKSIELRQAQPLTWLAYSSNLSINDQKNTPLSNDLPALSHSIQSHKVRMLLELPDSSEVLMKSFKSKLRSQIKKPIKEGLAAKIGGAELINDFYQIFLVNMRDLGSPVHSKKIIQNVLKIYQKTAKIVIVYRKNQPIAGSIMAGFRDTLENPWASSLREYSRFSPNMLLYWTMLEYACDNGFKRFDFGRSTPNEGTYKFKKQWGAKPEPLYWHYISLNGKPLQQGTSEKSKFEKAIRLWRKLPVTVTKTIGPMIRKHIGL